MVNTAASKSRWHGFNPLSFISCQITIKRNKLKKYGPGCSACRVNGLLKASLVKEQTLEPG